MTVYTRDGLIILPHSVGLRYKSDKPRYVFVSLQDQNRRKYMDKVLRDLKEYWKIHKRPDEDL